MIVKTRWAWDWIFMTQGFVGAKNEVVPTSTLWRVLMHTYLYTWSWRGARGYPSPRPQNRDPLPHFFGEMNTNPFLPLAPSSNFGITPLAKIDPMRIRCPDASWKAEHILRNDAWKIGVPVTREIRIKIRSREQFANCHSRNLPYYYVNGPLCDNHDLYYSE